MTANRPLQDVNKKGKRPREDEIRSTAARLILEHHDKFRHDFNEITRRAQGRFENCDWHGKLKDSVERLDLYEYSLDFAAAELSCLLQAKLRDRIFWKKIKRSFAILIKNRHDLDLLQSYFNSVTRKVLETVGIDREIEFFSLESLPYHPPAKQNVYKRYDNGVDTREVVRAILQDHRFRVPYVNLERDVALIAREIDLHLWPIVPYGRADAFEVINTLFYRNKAVYIVGRILAGGRIIPLCLPIYHGDSGVYVDTVLLTEAELSKVFSFAFSYFHVEIIRHDVLIDFLRSVLPHKPLSELYNSIGLNKHGKTELYRDLHRYVHVTHEKFVIAPGKEGAVMSVFTLPGYNFVFKVIKDRPCFLRSNEPTSKRIRRQEVIEQYRFVCHSDRVGRMVDTQEFENLRFKRRRFSRQLLKEFRLAAKEMVHYDGEYIVIDHLFVQRKVIPLPIYLMDEKQPEAIRRVVLDFGYFLKDLASVGIFPSDLFNIWNYGVTGRGRVVLYDYDDVESLESTHFRVKPKPLNDAEEFMAEEDRISALPNEFFLDETERYSGIPVSLRAILKSEHADLFTLKYWADVKRRVKRGDVFDISPYDRSRKFARD